METDDALSRFFAAKRLSDDGEQLLADLVVEVAAAGGVAVVDDLLASGHSRAVIAAALDPTGDDKRARPLLRGTVANGIEIVWCTTLGWSRAVRVLARELRERSAAIPCCCGGSCLAPNPADRRAGCSRAPGRTA